MYEIENGIYRLGDAWLPSFLIVGRERVLQIDAGPAFMAPRYLEDIKKILGPKKGPDLLLFTHSHFDHVGGSPYLSRHFPSMRFGGSDYLHRLLSLERAMETIVALNLAMMEKYGKGDLIQGDLDYSRIKIDLPLKDGDTISIGGGSFIEVISTSGHTRDSLSYFIPSIEAVFTGEAVGILPGDDLWVAPEFLSSYEDYILSIERIRDIKPKIVIPGHHSIVKGELTERFFEISLANCMAFKEKIENLLQIDGMDEEKIIGKIKEDEYIRLRKGRQPEEAYLLNLRAQVRLIAREMKKRQSGGGGQ